MSNLSIVARPDDSLLVTLNKANNYKSEFKQSLLPPIANKQFFRAISNHTVTVFCSFARTSYYVNAQGTIQNSQEVITNLDNATWYMVNDNNITTPVVYLVDPLYDYDSIDIVFEFMSSVPTDYIYRI